MITPASISGSDSNGLIRNATLELCVSIAEAEMCLTPTPEHLRWMRRGVRVNKRWIRAGVENQRDANRFRHSIVSLTPGWQEAWDPEPRLLVDRNTNQNPERTQNP